MIHKWLRIDIITDNILGQAIFQPYNIIYIYIYDHVNILFYDSAALNSGAHGNGGVHGEPLAHLQR